MISKEYKFTQLNGSDVDREDICYECNISANYLLSPPYAHTQVG